MSNEIQNQDANDLDKALEDKQEPNSLAEATTAAALDEDALGGHATEADRPKK